ncbi:hypothetical protein [Promicromonospora soli]
MDSLDDRSHVGDRSPDCTCGTPRLRGGGWEVVAMRSTRPIVLAGALLLLSAGCTTTAEPTPTPSVTTTSPSATPTPEPTPSPTTDDEQAAAQAEALVRDFYRVNDEIRSDDDIALSRLKDVATSTTLGGYTRLYEQERRDGEHQTGSTAIVQLEAQTVSLDNSDPEAGKVPTVVVDVCIDIRDIDILDSSGESVADPGRPETGWERHHVANYSWEKNPDGGWRVASSETLEKKPCSAE